MVGYLIAAVAAEALIIMYLLQKNHTLKNKCKGLSAEGIEIDSRQSDESEEAAPEKPSVDKLATHDTIVDMYESGSDIDSISEELKIPRSKVSMTLKIEKMKKDGSQQLEQ